MTARPLPSPRSPFPILRIVTLTLLFLFHGPPLTLAAEKPSSPNIIMVFIDDLGWGDFSCFGNTQASTPHIDRLAAEGLAFHQFYVNSPICSPSRAALTTGQYPQRWRITSYLNNRRDNARRGMADWLDLEAPTLSRSLQKAGYVTGHFGKWHLGGQRDVAEAPLITAYGFDESLTNFEGLGPRVLPLKYRPGQDTPEPHALGSHRLGHGPVIWQDRSRITETFTRSALTFARTAASRNQPFYINLWPDDVHTPMHPPLDQWGDGQDQTLYHAVLETMDRQLGELFDWVREDPSVRQNTLILICSDNGPEVGFGSPGPFRGSKATLYEAGIRSPLIAWGPELLAPDAAGTRNTTSIFSTIDLNVSLHALAETARPEALDGEDLLDTLLGRSQASRRQPLFFRRPPDRHRFRHFENLPDLAARSGPWKFYSDYQGNQTELYHLDSDPGETNDLSAREPEVLQRLRQETLAWHAGMPADRGPALESHPPQS